jgi:hypothetical protein
MSLQFDLHDLVDGSGKQTNFTTGLLKLIMKADSHNKELLRNSFPNAVSTVEGYQQTGIIRDLKYD